MVYFSTHMRITFLVGCLLMGLCSWQKAMGQTTPDTLAPIVFGTAGIFLENSTDSISLSFTMGEMMTQTAITQNGTLVLTQGFQQPEQFELVGIFVPPELTVDYQVFPNPTAGQLTLKLAGKEPTLLFVGIYDLRGSQTVIPEQRLGFIGQFETIFDLSPLPEGMYFLRIYDESRQLVETIKVQKAHR